jgi:hypothetical protein
MASHRTVALLVVLACRAFADGPGPATVVKDGHGEISVAAGGDDKALNDATERAIRTAITSAASVPMEGETPIASQMVKEIVFARRPAYLKSVGLVSARTEDGVAKADVKAELVPEKLDGEIKAAREMVKKAGKPTILFLVSELTKGPKDAEKATNVLGAGLAAKLNAEGWDAKDGSDFSKRIENLGAMPLEAEELKQLGESTKALFVVTGRVSFHDETGLPPTASKKGTFPVYGLYDLKIFSTETGAKVGNNVEGKLRLVNASEKEYAILETITDSYDKTAVDLMKRRSDELLAPMKTSMFEYVAGHPLKPKGCSAAPAELGLALLAWTALVRRKAQRR